MTKLCALAHDLNNQLQAIIGHCDHVLDGPEAVDHGMVKHLRLIRAMAANMTNQIQERPCPAADVAGEKSS